MKSEFFAMLRTKISGSGMRSKAGGARLVEIERVGEMPGAGFFVLAGDVLEMGVNYCIIVNYDEVYAWNNTTKKWDSVRYEGDLTCDHTFPNVAKAWQAVVDHKVPGE